ncbi:MAG TPA: transposase family protein [Streptosporangiaceae bacterium]
MPSHRISGLESGQLDELVELVTELLGEPWEKQTGRPRELTLRDAIIVACAYERHNITEEVLADIFGTSQPVISRAICTLMPLIKEATAGFRPSAEEAQEVVRGRVVLVDGFLAPCWSWKAIPGLWSGKHKTTGHNSQVVVLLSGDVAFVSEPVKGHNHDLAALRETDTVRVTDAAQDGIADKGYIGAGFVTPIRKPRNRDLYIREEDFNAQISGLRSPAERAIAHLKAWRILHTDYRRPLHTFYDSFATAIGLYFFKLSFG